MKKAFGLMVSLLLLLACLPAKATHLVGGELQMRNIGQYQYRITLNIYFDVLLGNPDAEDQQLTVSSFRKNGNVFVESFILNKINDRPVVISNPACTQVDSRTSILQYQTDVYLNPNQYNDQGGYYMSWERCCRNNIINNIYNPEATGMVFYMEFPAIQQGGQPFVNSSPVMAPVSGDILCTGTYFSYSFGATDADGDSLVYSLITPLAGHSSVVQPVSVGIPGPYAPVNWAFGYNQLQAIRGPLDLTVNQSTGLLEVIPGSSGLFVFTVRCEEYRAGRKIGEIRRDYQWKSTFCSTNKPPTVNLTNPATNLPYKSQDTIVITSQQDACLTLRIADQDAPSTLSIRALPVNFQRQLTVSPATALTTQPTDTAKILFCWPDCSMYQENPYLIDFIVQDNGCPQPKADTLRLTLLLRPKPNALPLIRTDISKNPLSVTVGDSVFFTIFGSDSIDLDQVTLSAEGVGFDLGAVGMQFAPATGTGFASAPFSWVSDCSDLALNKQYRVKFTARDNSCYQGHLDTVSVQFLLQDGINEVAQRLPANVFTPNGDRINDNFQLIEMLPTDNCANHFEKIEIFSRWGTKVYESKLRDFRWSGSGVPDGVYYYHVTFGRNTFKGTVTIMR